MAGFPRVQTDKMERVIDWECRTFFGVPACPMVWQRQKMSKGIMVAWCSLMKKQDGEEAWWSMPENFYLFTHTLIDQIASIT